MTNEEIYEKMMQISKRMKELWNEGNNHERNKLVPIWRELHLSYDWGFRVGDEVETIAWSHYYQKARIMDYNKEENAFLIKNDKGWEVWTRGMFLRRPMEKEDIEQMTLF